MHASRQRTPICAYSPDAPTASIHLKPSSPWPCSPAADSAHHCPAAPHDHKRETTHGNSRRSGYRPLRLVVRGPLGTHLVEKSCGLVELIELLGTPHHRGQVDPRVVVSRLPVVLEDVPAPRHE